MKASVEHSKMCEQTTERFCHESSRFDVQVALEISMVMSHDISGSSRRRARMEIILCVRLANPIQGSFRRGTLTGAGPSFLTGAVLSYEAARSLDDSRPFTPPIPLSSTSWLRLRTLCSLIQHLTAMIRSSTRKMERVRHVFHD